MFEIESVKLNLADKNRELKNGRTYVLDMEFEQGTVRETFSSVNFVERSTTKINPRSTLMIQTSDTSFALYNRFFFQVNLMITKLIVI